MGYKFEVKQDQLKKLLNAMAESKDGKQAEKKEMITEFRYAQKGGLPETAEDLSDSAQLVRVNDRLQRAVNDLSRKLRMAIGTRNKLNGPFSNAEAGKITSQIRVRCLIPDEKHHFTFGEK